MRTGFVSFARWDYTRSIAKADEFGFDYLELMMDGDAHRDVLEQKSDEVISSLNEHNIDLLVHFPYPMLIGSPHRHQREGAVKELKRCIEVATAVGAQKGVVHPDMYGWSRVWDEDHQSSILAESVRELDSFARGHGFEICVENLYGLPSLDIQQFDSMLSDTDVSMTFDTGHAAIAGVNETEIARFLSDNRDRVSHLHLNDTRHFDVGYQGQDEHLPLGYGSLDFEEILAPLIENDWEGTLSVELDTGDFEYLQTSKQRLERILS